MKIKNILGFISNSLGFMSINWLELVFHQLKFENRKTCPFNSVRLVPISSTMYDVHVINFRDEKFMIHNCFFTT